MWGALKLSHNRFHSKTIDLGRIWGGGRERRKQQGLWLGLSLKNPLSATHSHEPTQNSLCYSPLHALSFQLKKESILSPETERPAWLSHSIFFLFALPHKLVRGEIENIDDWVTWSLWQALKEVGHIVLRVFELVFALKEVKGTHTNVRYRARGLLWGWALGCSIDPGSIDPGSIPVPYGPWAMVSVGGLQYHRVCILQLAWLIVTEGVGSGDCPRPEHVLCFALHERGLGLVPKQQSNSTAWMSEWVN